MNHVEFFNQYQNCIIYGHEDMVNFTTEELYQAIKARLEDDKPASYPPQGVNVQPYKCPVCSRAPCYKFYRRHTTMFKIKKATDGTPPWATDFLVVTDDDHESIIHENNTLEQARRIVQLSNSNGGEGITWDELHEIMEREGFYL